MTEVVIFIGIQASGKSTFYRDRYFRTHVRINLDMLKTRHRELSLIQACLETGQALVVDNTNPSRSVRERYIQLAKDKRFRVIGYYFQSHITNCLARNELRPAYERIPAAGVKGTHSKLELPSYQEGFDELYYVQITSNHTFQVEPWADEI